MNLGAFVRMLDDGLVPKSRKTQVSQIEAALSGFSYLLRRVSGISLTCCRYFSGLIQEKKLTFPGTDYRSLGLKLEYLAFPI